MIEKEVAEKLVEVAQILGRMLEQSFYAFRKPTEASVEEVEQAVNQVRQSSAELTHFLIAKSSSTRKEKSG